MTLRCGHVVTLVQNVHIIELKLLLRKQVIIFDDALQLCCRRLWHDCRLSSVCLSRMYCG